MRILIYGAGVLGSLYAARLAESGHDVTLLARGQRLEELRCHGIVLLDEESQRETITQVALTDHLHPDDVYDLCMVVMRGNQVREILPVLGANRRIPSILFMVNNVAGPGMWKARVGAERILLGFPGAGGAKDGHAIRYSILDKGTQPTTLGELDGKVTPRLTAIAGALSSAGFPVAISNHMDGWLKTHGAVIVPIAAAILMSGGSTRKAALDPEVLRLCARAIKEAISGLRAWEIRIEPTKYRFLSLLPDPLLSAILRRIFAKPRSELTMARHAMGARDEIRFLAEDLMALVKGSGRPSPALDRIIRFV